MILVRLLFRVTLFLPFTSTSFSKLDLERRKLLNKFWGEAKKYHPRISPSHGQFLSILLILFALSTYFVCFGLCGEWQSSDTSMSHK